MRIKLNKVKTEYVTFKQDFRLESGRVLSPVTVAYQRYGKINSEKSNVILLCHALTGSAHAAFQLDNDDSKKVAGWWDSMVGAGKAFDTDKYHIICPNILGSCYGTTGPASIDPSKKSPYGLDFPVVTIKDMIKLQKILLDHLHIDKIYAVAGGSLGGMQVLEWGVNFPDIAEKLIVISATSKITPMAIAFNTVAREAIKSDHNFNDGNYYGKEHPKDGLAIARMAGHITYLSDTAFHNKFGRRLSGQDSIYDFYSRYEVENYLVYNGYKFTERFDANSYLYLLKAMDIFDLSYNFESLDEAVESIKAKVLLIDFTSDFLFPLYQGDELNDVMISKGIDVIRETIDAPYGHDSFLIEVNEQSKIIVGFLDK